MNKALLVGANIKAAHDPVDMNTAAITGARVKVGTGERLVIVHNCGDSTAATLEFTLQQHNAATAGTSKALAVMNPYYKKVGAATSFTKVEPTVAASVYDLSTDFAADQGVVVLEVLPEDLDVTNDFNYVSVNIADSAAAKIGATLYVVVDAKSQPAHSTAL